MLFWNKEPQIKSLGSPLSHQQPFAKSPTASAQREGTQHCTEDETGDVKGQTTVRPNRFCLAEACTQQQRLSSPKPCAAETPTRLRVMSSSQECFEVVQTREETTSKRDGERDEKVPFALSRSGGERRMLLQVSLRSGAPGALSMSPDGALQVWYGPAMGAAFSDHSFAPPWLEHFLSSLWFPSQCQCPAAGWERPGEEEASYLPRAAMAEEGELRRATWGRRKETHHWAAAHRVCQFWHRHPLPLLSLFDPGRPAHACRERVLWVMPRHAMPPVPSPCKQYSHIHPRSSSLQHRSPMAQRTQEQLLQPLRHAPLGGIYREAEELNGVIHSSAYCPPSSPHPNAPTHGQQGEAHASGSPATSSGVA